MPRKLLTLLALLALVVPVLAACGGGGDDDDDAEDGGSSSQSTDDEGTSRPGSNDDDGPAVTDTRGSSECTVKVTGDLTLEWETDGGVDVVGSDYWLSDDEIRETFEFVATGTEEEKKKQVEEAMAQDPRGLILLVNCISGDDRDAIVSISPSGFAKYADVPFGPGTYPIGRAGADDAKQWDVLLSTGGDEFWEVLDGGELNITRWDRKGVAATFRFEAEELFAEGAPKKISVQGEFDFSCRYGANCDN